MGLPELINKEVAKNFELMVKLADMDIENQRLRKALQEIVDLGTGADEDLGSDLLNDTIDDLIGVARQALGEG